MLRQKIYQIINAKDSQTLISKIYNLLNIVLIIISIVPLFFKNQTPILSKLNTVALVFFIIEYVLHLVTADIQYDDRPKWQAFLSYLFSFYGIIDLLSILPMLRFVSESFRLFRIFRLVHSLRIFRLFKIFRHTNSVDLMINAIRRQREPLQLVLIASGLYLLITSLVIFNIEPDSFPSYFDALFWSAGALTTATFGDYYPQTPFGQILGLVSFLVGILIVALPSSIITVGFLDELQEKTKIDNDKIEEMK